MQDKLKEEEEEERKTERKQERQKEWIKKQNAQFYHFCKDQKTLRQFIRHESYALESSLNRQKNIYRLLDVTICGQFIFFTKAVSERQVIRHTKDPIFIQVGSLVILSNILGALTGTGVFCVCVCACVRACVSTLAII